MKSFLQWILPGILMVVCFSCSPSKNLSGDNYNEEHRPLIHFSPMEKWMNDPNGMVYHKGLYHLMYQYYPDSTIWGPMHWGHAVSRNLVHWEHRPVALYPDSLGWIFSGSAVVDTHNSSGFGINGKAPLVAIFTHHNSVEEKTGSNQFQYQSLAYSTDDGATWRKYEGNPVLKNPGIRDFRDPKVMWFEPQKKWIMTLATLDRITFYSSPDLKEWTKESEFGKEFGAHGGVWECPDLFSLDHEGKKVWILLVSINPGGPNGGSATQYFTGEFDGRNFTPYQTDIRWIDYGPDDYAGVTWSNTGDRKVFLGWMNNWQYANIVPTEKWRGAATIPREISLEKIGEKYFLKSLPVKELDVLKESVSTFEDLDGQDLLLSEKTGRLTGAARLVLRSDSIKSFTLRFSNAREEEIVVGYDAASRNYFIDRTRSGKVSFEKGFARKQMAPRISSSQAMNLTIILDQASIELFADEGLTTMTSVFFPNIPFTEMHVQSNDGFMLKSVEYSSLTSIWK